MENVYIISGCRTSIGSFQGQFEKNTAADLGTVVITEAINRAGLKPENVEQVIMGQVLTAGQGQNPARQSAMGAKIPNTTPSFTINMLCGSGLKAVALGYQAIANKDYDIIVCGGQENMTRAEHTAYIRGNKMGNINLSDSLLKDGLTDAYNKGLHMGNTAENLANMYKISREEQDAFACKSQNKAELAITQGIFEKEIVGVPNKKTGTLITKDEFPKFGSTVEKLAKLSPCFDSKGTVTAGNASGINDGAAAVLLASDNSVRNNNLSPLAKIVGFAESGCDPIIMGIGPVDAVKKLLAKINWTKEEVDLYELNEAFASQSIAVNKELQIDESKINITGGAIALGHPIGASGTRILVTLIHNLQRLGKKKGVAALCIGGGMGIALAVEICREN